MFRTYHNKHPRKWKLRRNYKSQMMLDREAAQKGIAFGRTWKKEK